MSCWELNRFAPASITHKRTAWWNDLIVRWKQWFESSFTKMPKIGTNGWNPFCSLCARSRKPPRGFPPSSSCTAASPAGFWTSWGRLGRRDLRRVKSRPGPLSSSTVVTPHLTLPKLLRGTRDRWAVQVSFITNYSTGLAPFPRLSAPPHSPHCHFIHL